MEDSVTETTFRPGLCIHRTVRRATGNEDRSGFLQVVPCRQGRWIALKQRPTTGVAQSQERARSRAIYFVRSLVVSSRGRESHAFPGSIFLQFVIRLPITQCSEPQAPSCPGTDCCNSKWPGLGAAICSPGELQQIDTVFVQPSVFPVTANHLSLRNGSQGSPSSSSLHPGPEELEGLRGQLAQRHTQERGTVVTRPRGGRALSSFPGPQGEPSCRRWCRLREGERPVPAFPRGLRGWSPEPQRPGWAQLPGRTPTA